MRHTITTGLLLILLLACRKETNATATSDASTAVPATATAGAALTPEQLGELGARIKKEPARAGELLKTHGLTPQTFESEIRRISSDPDLSRRYAAAFKQHGG